VTEFLTPELWVKLALSIACGAAIGLERELHDKPAGLRTNMMICVGSTLITMVSLHIALAYSQRQVVVGDPGRIAGEMISGIGFLGAGAIIQSRGSVQGLTTAATIWFLAGIGLAIGSGFYAPAIATTVILLGILAALGWLENRISKPRHFAHYEVEARREAGVLDKINEIADQQGLSLESFKLARKKDGMEIQFALTSSSEARGALIERLLEIDAVEDVRVNV
jgi:putative Mg2+ transporter-C (MgtC) family protein